MSQTINRLTVKEMAELSGVSEAVITQRVNSGVNRRYKRPDGSIEYKVYAKYLQPAERGGDGLITVGDICLLAKLTEKSLRSRIKTRGITPDYILDDGHGTGMWRMSHDLIDHLTARFKKEDRLEKTESDDERVRYKGISRRLVDDERRKMQWIGRLGILHNGRNVMARGRIEYVTSMGVIVNGVSGQLWMLQLAEPEAAQ